MAGIPSLNFKIAHADDSGTASWNGTNGIKEQLTEVATLLGERGVMIVSSLSALALLSTADTNLALVKGKALYWYNPSTAGTVPAANIVAQGGGQWEYLCTVGSAPYTRVIGDATNTVFTITHGKDTLTPDVTVYDTLNGLPYPVSTDYVKSIVDANTIQITSDTVWGGNSHTVVVKNI